MANPQQTIPPNLQSPTTLSLVVATAIVSSLAGYFLGQASSLGVFSSSSSSSASSSRKSKRKRESSSSRRKREAERGGSGDVNGEDASRDIKFAQAMIGDGDGEIESESEPEATPSISPSSSEDETSDSATQPLATFANNVSNNEDFKMTLLLRTDLGMTKGKMAAQAAHAALLNYTILLQQSSSSSSQPPFSSPSKTTNKQTTHPALQKWQQTGQAKIALQVGSLAELEDVRRKAVEAGLCAGVVRDAGRTQVVGGSVTACAVGPGPRGVVDSVSGGLRLL